MAEQPPKESIQADTPGGGAEPTLTDEQSGSAPGSPAQDLAAPLDSEESALPRGTTLGKYVILDKLGAGGMGVVHSAYDAELQRRVALKLLPVEREPGSVSTSDVRARLLREAQALARLSHPNVVTVFDAGIHEGHVYMALELVEGQTLGAWLKDRPRTWREVLRVFVPAGRGLAAAHAAGMVHRDIKPDNVLLGRDGRVRVSDFGLARSTVSPVDEPSREGASTEHSGPLLPLTLAGQVMGTPPYMAPEQARNAPADARTDQFSFCVALYEALYGQRPFKRVPLHHPQRWNLLPDPPGRRVPRWLRRAVRRGLALEPAQRHPSVEALVDTLARTPVRRQQALLGGATLATVALLVTGAHRLAAREPPCRDSGRALAGALDEPRLQAIRRAFLGAAGPKAAEPLEKVQQTLGSYAREWARMRTDACEATRVRGDQSDEDLSLRMACLDRRLSELRALSVLLSEGVDAALVKEAPRAALALTPVATCADLTALRSPARLPESPQLREKVEKLQEKLAEGTAVRRAGRYEAAHALLAPLVSEATALRFRPLEAELHNELGRISDDLGRQPEAESHYTRAFWSALAGAHPRELVTAAMEVALLHLGRDQVKIAREWLERARLANERLGGEGQLFRLELLEGMLLTREGRSGDAIAHLESGLKACERQFGKDSAQAAPLLGNIADAYYSEGRLEDAERVSLQAHAISARVLGLHHPRTVSYQSQLATFMVMKGRTDDEALAWVERVHAALAEAHGPEHAMTLNMAGTVVYVLTMRGDYLRALAVAQEKLAALERTHRDRTTDGATTLSQLAYVQSALGRYDQAIASARRALEARGADEHPDDPDTIEARTSLARGLVHTGRIAQGLAELQRALKTVMASATFSYQRPAVHVALLEAHLAAGKWRAALAEAERGLALLEPGDEESAPERLELLLGLGEAQLNGRQPDRALAPLERALQLVAAAGHRPFDKDVRAHLLLARALSSSRGSQRPRALELLHAAEKKLSSVPEAGEPASRALQAKLARLRQELASAG